MVADGGTNIGAAIEMALAQPVTSGYLRQVIFLTDGAVGAETALFTAIEQRLGDARLFTIGIGSAPNSYFMRKAAQFGRGTYTHIGDIGDVSEKMTALFAKLERVALSDVAHRLARGRRALSARDSRTSTPASRSCSRRASPRCPTGRCSRRPSARPRACRGGRPSAAVPSELPGIAALWARRKIEHLIDSRVAGVDEALIRKLVIETALEHHLVSPYTSLVAVDKTPARSAAAALERRNIDNTMPAGAQWQAAFPQTATPGPLLRWLGAIALLAAASLLARRAARRGMDARGRAMQEQLPRTAS